MKETTKGVIQDTQCVVDKVKVFVDGIANDYTKDGKWVTIEWYEFKKWSDLAKRTLAFVKDVLLSCLGIKFEPRVPGFLEKIFGSIFS